ncbi:MAG: XdhC family protein [Acidobacteria bacterium]|nr:XdhC family protein [Acidobacteriota bacterium]MBE3130520.1 XdhC family protein [Acidobacteriota bacterium]
MKYSFPKLLETLAGGKGLALATIVEAEGSTPQITGASAIFSVAGLEAGTVGGGLLEARAEAIAGEALRDRKARLITIRLDADPADLEGAICGGSARVLIDPGVGGERAVFERALDGFRKRRPGVLASLIVPGQEDFVSVERRFLEALSWDANTFAGFGPDILAAALEDGRPRLVKSEGRLIFLEPVRPLPRLIIAGAGHVGRAVARLGSLLDWSVTVIDDRPEFANAENVSEADEIVVGDIGESVRRIEDSTENYFVIVTRGHKKDAEALRAAIGRPAAYVGMIGSKRKIEIMHCEFLESGWATADAWAGVHAPIGVEIGSKTVEEIAVSIAAELVLVRSGRKERGGT